MDFLEMEELDLLKLFNLEAQSFTLSQILIGWLVTKLQSLQAL